MVNVNLESIREYFPPLKRFIARLREDVMNCKLRILDDIGAERPSEYVCERLYDLIRDRHTNMLYTIYTLYNNLMWV